MSENKFEKHGRIVTQNSDLLRLLRDKTEESLEPSRFLSKNVGKRKHYQNNQENVKQDSYGRFVPNQGLEQPDLDDISGIKSRHPSGSKVFSVVNPALLRAVGIKPTPEQQANFDSYSPRKNIPYSQAPVVHDQRSTKNQGKAKFDSNNNSSADITYNNYLAEPFDHQHSGNYLQKGASSHLQTSDNVLKVQSDESLKPSQKNSNYSIDSLDPKESWSDVKEVKSTEPVSSFNSVEASRVDLGKAITATSQTSMTSTKSPLQRVYIESPTFTQAEEEEYRFVSSRVDDYGDNQNTFRNLPAPEPTESVSPMKGSKGSRRVHYEDAPAYVDSSRYEDVDESESNTRVNNSRQYVLKPSESNRSALSQPSELTVAPRQLPEKAPGLGHRLPTGPSYDPDDEDELERETNYQVNLITRIGENTKRVSDLSVPKLTLPPDSDEEFARDSLDVEDTPHNNFVKDSLDLYNPPPSEKDSYQYRGSNQGVHQNQSPFKHQNRAYLPPNSYQQHQMIGHEPSPNRYSQSNNHVEPWQEQYQNDHYSQGYQQHNDQTPTRQPGIQPRFSQHEDNEESYYAQGDMYAQPIPQQTRPYQVQESPKHNPVNEKYMPSPPAYRVGYQGNENEYSQHMTNPKRVQPSSGQYFQDPQAQNMMKADPRSNQYQRKNPHLNQYEEYEDPRFQNFQHPDSSQFQSSRNLDPRVQPGMNQDPRSQPGMNQDPRSKHMNVQDPRSQHMNVQDPRSQPMNMQDPRSKPMNMQDPRSQPMNMQDLRPHHIMADPSHVIYDRASQDRYSYDSYQDQGYDEDDPNYYDDDPTPTNEGTLSPEKQPSGNEQPKVDYIENNRKNYGRVQKKSYQEIQQIKKEEGVKLENRFIKPKVKPKKKQPNSAPVNNSKASERYASSPQLNQKPTTAEELWAKKASNLSTKKVPKKQGKLTKYPSDGGLPIGNRKPQDLPPDGYLNSPLRKPLQPISRDLVTEDGHRISVDVNLKLLTPPESGSTNLYSHQAFEQYPVNKPYQINPVYAALGPAYQQNYESYDSEQYYPEQRQDYPSARDYESAPEYMDYSQPGNLPEGRPVSSPYKVIPPIPTSSGSSPTKPINPEDSYVVQYRRQKEKKNEEPWYKIYNLKDYRKMQKEVRLGSLGPDLDNTTHKEKIEKFQRQNDYARMVNERNKKQTVHKRPPSYPRKQELDEDMISKRKLAVEYSKTIPKPAVKPNPNGYNSYEVSGQIPMGGKLLDSPRTADNMDVIDLENLRLRHERDKQNVEAIKQNMDLQKA